MVNKLLNVIIFSWLCYPILGALYISFGIIFYQFLYKDKIKIDKLVPRNNEPSITIEVAAHNEQNTLFNTVKYLATQLNYNNYEILIIDDGSTDDTLKVAQKLQDYFSKVRIIHIDKNNGKAHALNVGLGFANGDFILSNDADTFPEQNALKKYMNYFLGKKHQNVGAVTGNMNVHNRKSMLGKTQIVEFSSIVGGIKRSHATTSNSMYAFSGANTMYRKMSIIDVGGFRQNRATEDISIAWDLNFYQWQTKFASNIQFFMIVPDNIKDLYHQRKRWAQGGTEVWIANFRRIFLHPILLHKQISIYIDNTLSNIWSFLYFISSFIFIINCIKYFFYGEYNKLFWLLIINIMLICIEYIAGFIQLSLSLYYDNKGKKRSYLKFAPLYISMLWIVNPLTIVVTFIKAINTLMGKRSSGTWGNTR